MVHICGKYFMCAVSRGSCIFVTRFCHMYVTNILETNIFLHIDDFVTQICHMYVANIFSRPTFLCILMTNIFAYLWQFVVCALWHGSCILLCMCVCVCVFGTHMCDMVHSPVCRSYACVTHSSVCDTLICVTWSYLCHTSIIRPIRMSYRAPWSGYAGALARCIHIRDTTLSYVTQGYALKIQQGARTLKKLGVKRYGITHPFVRHTVPICPTGLWPDNAARGTYP